MEPMRWNNADSNPGARPQTSAFRGDKGLDVANQNRASGAGRKMFLTCPYIEPRTDCEQRPELCALTADPWGGPADLDRGRIGHRERHGFQKRTGVRRLAGT